MIVINDCIHGLISLPGYLFDYIDTPQFQRLKNIKQLGGTYYVYPGAAHNRFEHSIGVCYLAGRLARNLQKGLDEYIRDEKNAADPNMLYLKDAKMSDNDLKCIEIAALCHDLGHGPMSHLFDQMFYSEMKRADPENVRQNWTHEVASQEMFDLLVVENKVDLPEDDQQFVKGLIVGKPLAKEKPARKYMYEIVANERNGIDVDRMDCNARDCHGLGMKSNFDHLRYFLNCRVNVIDNETGETSICVREKEMFDLVDLFSTRDGLYRKAYRHRVTSAIQFMISDVFVSANGSLKVTNQKGDEMTMIESLRDMSAYQKFTDGVLDYIMMAENDKLKEAKDLLKRIYKRDLYKCIIETSPMEVTKDKKAEQEEEKAINEAMSNALETVSGKPNWIVERIEFKTGFKGVYFYKKNNGNTFYQLKLPNQDKRQEEHVRVVNRESKPETIYSKEQNWIDIEASLLLPEVLKEKVFRIYSKTHGRKGCKDENEFNVEKDKRDKIEQCARRVLEEKGFSINPLI